MRYGKIHDEPGSSDEGIEDRHNTTLDISLDILRDFLRKHHHSLIQFLLRCVFFSQCATAGRSVEANWSLVEFLQLLALREGVGLNPWCSRQVFLHAVQAGHYDPTVHPSVTRNGCHMVHRLVLCRNGVSRARLFPLGFLGKGRNGYVPK